jgi:glycosyltransferase involved in cell wall biosynthesis
MILRVCMVTSVPMPPAEGIGYYVWNLSHFLLGQGHRVQIITRGQRGRPSREELEGIPIWRPRFYPTYPLHVHLHGLFVQRLVRRLEAEVDVFHLHTPLPPPICSHRPFLVTVHTSMAGEAKAIPIRDLRSLIVRLQLPFHIQTEHKLFADAGQIAVVAQTVADELRGYGMDGKQVQVLGNGVDVRLFRPAEQGQATQSDEMYLLAAGRLDVRKGLVDLIEAMSHVVERFPAAKLYIAGSGPLEGQLRTRITQLHLENSVRLLGHVGERAEMIQLYRDAAAFVHAAHYEGLPTVLLEAMACRKAIASTAVSGILDVIENNVNGLLVPPQRPEQLAEAICRLLGDAALCAQLGADARRTVKERFSWQVVGANYLHCYQALLDGISQ